MLINRYQQMNFCRPVDQKMLPTDVERVMMEINVSTLRPTSAEHSKFPHDQEILFDLGALFKITKCG
jgi:hypothetical protein